MFRRSFIALLGGSLLALGSSGCIIDHTSRDPVIDDLNFPPAAVYSTDGTYTLNGFISFHGDNPVNQLRIRQSYGGDSIWPFPAAISAVDAPVTIKFSAATPRGTQPVTLSVIDTYGYESSPATIYVDIY